MAALDLPPIPLGLPPADPNVAEAQAQARHLAAQQGAAQQQQQQIQRTGLENQAAQHQILGQTAAADAARWANSPAYAGKDFQHLPTEARQHFVDAYGPIANQIPGVVNSAQRSVTGNPDIGIPAAPAGSIESRTVGPDGQMHRSYQVDNANPATAAGSDDPIGSLPKGESDLAKAIASYQLPYAALSRMPPLQRARILGAVTQADPNFDANQYPTRQATMKSFAAGPDAANAASANTVMGHLNELYDAGKQLNNGGVPAWNSVTNSFEKNIAGNPAQTRFASASNAVADEMAKLFKGTGAATDATIKDWKSTISPNMSPEQLKASIATALSLMQSRLSALGEKYQNTMGKPLDRPILSPKSQAIIRNLQREGLAIPNDAEQPQAETAQVDPRMELAKRALGDPAASPEHKAAAKRLLGIP